MPKLIALVALLAAATPVAAQEDAEKLTALSALNLCRQIVDAPAEARALLQSRGWSEYDYGEELAEIYDEPEAGWFVRGDDLIVFLSKDTAMGQRNPEFFGTCEALFYGEGNMGATEIAASLSTPATSYEPEAEPLLDFYKFRTSNYLITIGNKTSRDDRATANGTVRLVILPK